MTSRESESRSDHSHDDLGASGRATTVCLTVGIALFLFILAIPYLNDL